MPTVPNNTEQDTAIQDIKTLLEMMKRLYRNTSVQRSCASFTLDHGRGFYMNNRTFDGRRGQKRACYKNAFDLAADDSRLTYVEGWCNIGLPIEHAWCADKEGNVIDPTLIAPKDCKTSITPRGYFGVPFKTDYILKTAFKTGIYGVIPFNRELILEEDKDFLATIGELQWKE